MRSRTQLCRIALSSVLALAGAAPGSAQAGVTRSSAGSFLLEQRIIVKADSKVSFQGLLHPERWWSKDHTLSGNAANMRLDPRAGGCWCERWSGGEVEHARVIFIQKDKLLRLQGAFGPLQALEVTGILEFTLTQGKDGTQVDMSYRISGPDSAKLDAIAPMADQMFAGQLASLKAMLDRQGEAARK